MTILSDDQFRSLVYELFSDNQEAYECIKSFVRGEIIPADFLERMIRYKENAEAAVSRYEENLREISHEEYPGEEHA